MKSISIERALITLLAVASLGIATIASAQSKPDYFEMKAGVYTPSASRDLDSYTNSTRDNFDSNTGFAGEVVFGHYFLPMVALELGGGYFESKGSIAAKPGDLKLKVVPLVATGKVLLPLGLIEPYGLFGIGAYITDLNDSSNTISGSTDITYGLHVGAGVNINIQENMFVGVEAKYLWAEPSFGGQHINLDGFITTAAIGFRY